VNRGVVVSLEVDAEELKRSNAIYFKVEVNGYYISVVTEVC
jgi:hypothetical protein